MSDPQVAAVPVHDSGTPLVRLHASFGPARALVRADIAERLNVAQAALPEGLKLLVVEGHRSRRRQQAIIAEYERELRISHPDIDEDRLRRLTSRFVAPLAVAPHVAGAAVDLTITGPDGALDMGTPIDATPEQSGGACYFDADAISATARANRTMLAQLLSGVGLVNYPTEWWHWSYGDRYWAVLTGSPTALHGPVHEPLLHEAAATTRIGTSEC